MFTHRRRALGDALTKGLMHAGPFHHHRQLARINTEGRRLACTSKTRPPPTAQFSRLAVRVPSCQKMPKHSIGKTLESLRCRGCPQARRRISGSGHSRRGFVSRLLPARRWRNFQTLAVETRHAQSVAALDERAQKDLFPEEWIPTPVSPGGRLERRTPRSQSCAWNNSTHQEGQQRTRSAARHGSCWHGMRPSPCLPLRRSVAACPRRRR